MFKTRNFRTGWIEQRNGVGRRLLIIVLSGLLVITTLAIIPDNAYGEGDVTETTTSEPTEGEAAASDTTVPGTTIPEGSTDSETTDSESTTTVAAEAASDTDSTTTSMESDEGHEATESTTTSMASDEEAAAEESVSAETTTTSTVDDEGEEAEVEPEMVTMLLEGFPVEVPADSVVSDPGASLQANVPSAPNPPLSSTCGLNIALVFDRSGSVSPFETQFKNAAKAFVDALQGTPSTIGLTGFAGISEVGGNGIGQVRAPMTEIATVAGANTVKAAIDAIPFGGLGNAGGTNWEDGFKVIGGLAPPIDVILFMTDGNPTTHDGSLDLGFFADPADLDAGVTQANVWKTNGTNGTGTRIIAVGIGDDVTVANLIDISGPTQGSDYFLTDFETIGSGLQDLAIASCTSTITITKNVDDNNDGVFEVSDGNPDWTFTADATQSVGSLTWQNPTGTNPVSGSVGADGVILFDWLLDELDATTDVDITETVNPDWVYDAATSCTVKTFEQPTAQPFPVTENGTGDGFSLSAIPRDGVIACDVFNTGVLEALVLTKTASPTAVSSPGVVNYTFSIENTGNVALTNITVTDPLPGLVISGGPIASLAPGSTDSTTISATYTVTQAQIDAGTPIPNTATATSDEGVSDSDDATVTIVQNPALTLLKSGTVNDGGDGVDAGDTITYAFTVTNSGNVTVTDITIDDPVAGVTVDGGPIDLAPGAADSTTFTGTYTITQADINAGEFENCATANGTGPDGETPVASEETCTTDTLPQTPLINLVKDGTLDDGGDGVDPGDIINYTFTITNTGNVTLTDVTVTDTVGGVTIVGTPIPTMAPGAVDSTTFTGTYAITQDDINAGVFENTATVTGTDPDGAPVTNSDTHVVEPEQEFELTLTKDADLVTISAPQTITYDFVIQNTGNTTLKDVQLADPDLTTGPTCDWDMSSDPITGPNELTPGETVPCTGTYEADQDDIDDGADLVNLATATSNFAPDATATATVTIQQTPGLVLTKSGTVDDGEDGVVDAGDTITYTFTVQNTGNITLFMVDIVEDVVGVTVTGGPIPSLAPGVTDTDTFTGEYTITQTDIDAGTFQNCATPTGIEEVDSNDVFTGTQGCTSNDLPQVPFIAIDKTGVLDDGDDDVATPGDVITYAFTITNTGNVTLTGVALIDPVVTDAACDWSTASQGSPEFELAPDETVECTGTYAITQIEIDMGFRDNTAIATGVPPIGGEVSAEDTVTVDIEQEPGLELTKTADPTSISSPGVVSYTFSITNTGNVTLTTITLSDLLTDLTISGGPIAMLLPGDTDSTTFTATLNVSQVHIDAGDDIVNTATANSAQGASDNDSATVDIVQDPGLTILKEGVFNDESGDGFAQVGETISYFFVVTNTGNVTLTGITVNDSKVTVVGGPIDLAPGFTNSVSFTAEHTITQEDIDAAFFENCATATGTPPGEEVEDVTSEESCTTAALPDPSMELIKTGTLDDQNGDGFAQLGEPINYTFTVTNTGNVTLTDVTVSDTIGGVTITGGPIPSLAPGAVDSTTFTGTYLPTQVDIDRGNFHNVAIVTGSSPDQSDDVTGEAEEDTRLPHDPQIDLVKNGALDLGGNGQIDVGDVIVYTFTVTNTGNVTLWAPTLTDLSVLGLDLDCPWDGVEDYSIGIGFENRVNCTATYLVTQADIDAGEIENCASIIALSPAEVPVTDEDCFTVDEVQEPGIEIMKTAINPEVVVGGTVTFEITVTNTGNVTLDGVVVEDVLSPSCDRTFGAILTPGDTVTYECTVENVTDDFVNVATATGTPPTTDIDNPPDEVTDEDDAPVTVVDLGEIGDTVWNDVNENGVQDNGEKGVSGVTVRLTKPDGTSKDAVTNGDGWYLFTGLPAGEYTSAIILDSVVLAAGDDSNVVTAGFFMIHAASEDQGGLRLTTAGSFTIQLAEGESYLDADFGVVATLPDTGIESSRIALIALALLLAGALAIAITTGKREDEGDLAT